MSTPAVIQIYMKWSGERPCVDFCRNGTFTSPFIVVLAAAFLLFSSASNFSLFVSASSVCNFLISGLTVSTILPSSLSTLAKSALACSNLACSRRAMARRKKALVFGEEEERVMEVVQSRSASAHLEGSREGRSEQSASTEGRREGKGRGRTSIGRCKQLLDSVDKSKRTDRADGLGSKTLTKQQDHKGKRTFSSSLTPQAPHDRARTVPIDSAYCFFLNRSFPYKDPASERTQANQQGRDRSGPGERKRLTFALASSAC
jgi:hypothetical protein